MFSTGGCIKLILFLLMCIYLCNGLLLSAKQAREILLATRNRLRAKTGTKEPIIPIKGKGSSINTVTRMPLGMTTKRIIVPAYISTKRPTKVTRAIPIRARSQRKKMFRKVTKKMASKKNNPLLVNKQNKFRKVTTRMASKKKINNLLINKQKNIRKVTKVGSKKASPPLVTKQKTNKVLKPSRESVKNFAQVKSQQTQCTYNLIVNEVDPQSCPGVRQSSAHHTQSIQGLESKVEKKEVDSVKEKVNDIEKQLYKEMLHNQVLNGTLDRQQLKIRRAESMLWTQQKNITSLNHYIHKLEEDFKRTKNVLKSLETKMSGVMLNMGELMTTVEQSIPDKTNIKDKSIYVSSAGRLNDCKAVSKNSTKYKDCAALYSKGYKKSGVYYIKPIYSPCPIPVWCDMDTYPGGWLMLTRRGAPGKENFDRDWGNYSEGFGNLTGEFWLGNENMFLLTNQARYKVRFDLWDFYNSRVYAEYDTFWLGGERDSYQLHVANHSGTVRDGMGRHDGMFFSTPDRDNDAWEGYHCAIDWKCGWWFNNCWFVILNGPFFNQSIVKYKGIAWNDWKSEQLSKSEMKIRPVDD